MSTLKGIQRRHARPAEGGHWAQDRAWQRAALRTGDRLCHQGTTLASSHLHEAPAPPTRSCLLPASPRKTGRHSVLTLPGPYGPTRTDLISKLEDGSHQGPAMPDPLSLGLLEGKQPSHTHPTHITHTHTSHLHPTHIPCAPLVHTQWEAATLPVPHKTHSQTP